MDQTNCYPVKLYIYDLSRGMARQLSPLMLGKQLDGICDAVTVCWRRSSAVSPGGSRVGFPVARVNTLPVYPCNRHTAVVVHGKEFFFVGEGINSCPPGGTPLGEPDSVVDLGFTEVPAEILMEHLTSLAESTYSGDKYNLFEHNCNSFSNEVAQFLTGKKIPSYITDLPSEVLSTPFGQALRPLLDSVVINPEGNNISGQR